ncbi:MAG: efflux RND transporter periplasmic adaptor subunit [Gemmatimonadaceae bacterium]|nr:efflux RND transporter periplasmic adaptor subunit [Gemmatimonadaceae bacterium]
MTRPTFNPRTVVALALASSLAATSCGRGRDADDEGGAGGESAQAVVTVRTVVAAPRAFTETVGAIGDVEARVGHSAAVGAPGPARIARVLVAAGQHVSAGDVLVKLDQTSFHAAAQSAEAQLAASEKAYQRAKRLADEGVVPRKDVEQAQADLAKAQADAATARRQAQLSVLRAPITGVVTAMHATLGATADPAQPLVEIADPAATDVVLDAPPADAARMRTGAHVDLVAGQSAGGESLGDGVVADVGGMVDPATRSVSVRVHVTTARRPLRIGETVFGQVATATRANAIVLPLEALVPEGDGFKVFVVDSANVAHARPVTVGARTDRAAEVTSGVRAGERVVTYGAYGVADGAKVVVAAGDGT